MKLWYNGEMMNVEDAKIPLTWMSPRISSGVFDGARGYWNNKKKKLYVFRLKEHMDRFGQGCRIQLANYNNYRLATLEAYRNGYEDYFSAIMLNQRGKVAEGAMAALFIIEKGQVITPSVSSDILESITRDALIQLFKNEFQLPVVERDVDRTELYTAEEVLLCGTGSEIIPVKSIDRYPVGNGQDSGPITRKMIGLFERICRGEMEPYSEWITEITSKKRS